jgi:heptaprenyl diphosphate synthase
LWSKYPEIYNELNAVEEFIRQNTRSRNKLLSKIVEDLFSAGGKRLRPALAIISARFGNYDSDKIVSIAGAIETLHTATLVHDDIIDRSKLRRGKVTVSEKYGSDMAVYTGDFLFTKAVLMLSKGISAEKLEQVARAVKTICEGEVDQFEDRFNTDTTVYVYLKRINRKTAALFASACALGADASECTKNVLMPLSKFGLYFGMAFQIRDDIHDILLSSESTGKPEGSDAAKGVITLPVIYSMKGNKALKDRILSLKEKEDSVCAEEIFEIKKMIREAGGIEKSSTLLDKYIQKGLAMLESLPQNPYRTALEDIIKMLGVELTDKRKIYV